jgi:glycosyltransferase involved in cell wall biosynthesis
MIIKKIYSIFDSKPYLKMKISLLIPVFNYDIAALVHGMKNAYGKVPEFHEIIIGDDGSSAEYKEKYRSLEDENVKVIFSEKNIGRSAIRNKLALEAAGDILLFIDSDAMLPGTAETYISKWIPYITKSSVICGGILYRDSPPGDPDKLLRWKYGKQNEQLDAAERNKHPHARFSAFNVIIDKSIFEKIRFNEDLKQYGHEDTLMGYQLKKAGIDIIHIDNGLVHEGLESNLEYLSKTKLGLENLSRLYDIVTDKKTFSATCRMLRSYNILNIIGLTRFYTALFIRFRDRIEIRLDTGDTSLRLFKFYKFCMFCTFREIHLRKKFLAPH